MDKITSVTRLPHNAFGSFRDVPSSQDKHYRKEHRCTVRGLKNAVGRIKKEWRDYSESNGNGAVCGGWIETPCGKIGGDYAKELIDGCYLGYFNFTNADGLKLCMVKLNEIIDQVNEEFDEQDRLERERLEKEYPEGYGY